MLKKASQEEGYFHTLDAHHSKKLLEKREKEELQRHRDELKRLHGGRCAGCGNMMDMVLFHGREVMRCSSCNGVFLKGEYLSEFCGDEKNFFDSLLEMFSLREEK